MTPQQPSPLDPAVLARIERLELEARQVVEGMLAGRHRSPRHGFAVEFAQHRPYVPGDDLKHIDWKVYGRTERFHLKQYEQEINLVAWMLVDASESMSYASAERSKYDVAAIAAAALSYMVLAQTDSVGLMTLSGLSSGAELRPSSQRTHLREICRVLAPGPGRQTTNIGQALHQLAPRMGRRGIVFLLSDLLDEVGAIRQGLQHLVFHKHEVIVFHVLDAAELDFPFRHLTLFRGLEGLPDVLTDPASIRESYLRALAQHQAALQSCCRELEIDYVLLRTDADLGHELAAYLQKRRQQR
ncbi:DUF58 domain-containing protein [Thermogemmata fonticola]|uniref:DUF58 domain-containing protein n=1 Tax=Thermogemmata fonticola TaxID=2755323 RepID=A0A7V8VCF6_9BACT|nr:DUF58 domain-containing protein [Thermogemmata fonticola]MBA2225222.1 DUF58 domain-containing protein [Thermogemmata fonticola]